MDGDLVSLVQIRYVRTYTPDNSGTAPVYATPTLMLSGTITDGVSQTVVPAPIQCTVNTSGQLVGPDGQVGVLLYATDKTSTSSSVEPTNRVYWVSGEPGLSTWSFEPSAADPNPCDLASRGNTL
jgi:hypothetical protein